MNGKGEQHVTAIHEAGHYVARAFLGGGTSNVAAVTIVPTDTASGQVVLERCHDFQILSGGLLPARAAQPLGRRMLMEALAGPAAEARLNGDDALLAYADFFFCPDWALPRDYLDAGQIVECLAAPNESAAWIWDSATEWTEDLLSRPDIWAAIEAVASLLIADGTVDGDDDRLWQTVEPICDGALRDPTWRRRLRIQ